MKVKDLESLGKTPFTKSLESVFRLSLRNALAMMILKKEVDEGLKKMRPLIIRGQDTWAFRSAGFKCQHYD